MATGSNAKAWAVRVQPSTLPQVIEGSVETCASNRLNVPNANVANRGSPIPAAALWEPNRFSNQSHAWERSLNCEGPLVQVEGGMRRPTSITQAHPEPAHILVKDLEELPEAIRGPKAVVLDLILHSGLWEELSQHLMEQAVSESSMRIPLSMFSDGCKLLAGRIPRNGADPGEREKDTCSLSSHSPEPALEPATSDASTQDGHDLKGGLSAIHLKETLDVTLCPLECIHESTSPFIVFVRLGRTIELGGQTVRFAAMVVCSNNPSSVIHARRLARTLVVMFCDEEFVSAAGEASTPSEFLQLIKYRTEAEYPEDENAHAHKRQSSLWRARQVATGIKAVLQKYSIPLILGVLISLIWANTDADSHDYWCHKSMGFSVFSHDMNLHFIVNDIFMVFFFGLASKEVTEALLPGGTLYPISTAVNPLMATCGGVIGPVATYYITVFILYEAGSFGPGECSGQQGARLLGVSHRLLGGGGGGASAPIECRDDGGYKLESLLRGWGVPTATDISLAWMLALFIFGNGHPAINYLLLLAVVDDALGMGIIAIFYPDPENPVRPEWLGLVLLAMVIAFALRKAKMRHWQMYVCLAGPVSWIGLLQAHVHPALSLVFVIPFLPHILHHHTQAVASSLVIAIDPVEEVQLEPPNSSPKNNVEFAEPPKKDGDGNPLREVAKEPYVARKESYKRAMSLPSPVEMDVPSISRAQTSQIRTSRMSTGEFGQRMPTEPRTRTTARASLSRDIKSVLDLAAITNPADGVRPPRLKEIVGPTTPNEARRSMTKDLGGFGGELSRRNSMRGSFTKEFCGSPTNERGSTIDNRRSMSNNWSNGPTTPNSHRRSDAFPARSAASEPPNNRFSSTYGRALSNDSRRWTNQCLISNNTMGSNKIPENTELHMPENAETSEDTDCPLPTISSSIEFAADEDDHDDDHDHEAPLHKFEHQMKWPVDCGMFFFGLVNAGVKIDGFGGITIAVLVSLIIGKALGITLMGLLAVRLGFALPAGLTFWDLLALSVLAGMGLTVALFVAGVAFVDAGLQAQAKMGALLSVGAFIPAALIRRFCTKDEDDEEVFQDDDILQ